MLDPQIEDMDRERLSGKYLDPFGADTTTEARRRAWLIRDAIYPAPDIQVGSVVNRTISTPVGDIAIRIIRPAHGKADATVVYFHGGGWMVGDLDSHQAHAARIANSASAVVVNVDYRLAPDHQFPAATDDAFAAMDWIVAHIDELGGDASKLAVSGDSAGGNIAAACAIRARDMGTPLAAQLLIYPATDLRPKSEEPSEVTRKYLGQDCLHVSQDWRASPIVADLSGIAPVIIGTGAHDFLFEDNKAFVAQLEAAGVPVTFRIFPELNHSYFSYAGVSEKCAKASDLICNDLSKLLHG